MIRNFQRRLDFAFYIQNTSDSRRVSANVRQDTATAGQSFNMLDNQGGAYVEQFPLYYEHRLAPNERREVGCTAIVGVDSTGYNLVNIPVNYDIVGAVFVNPSDPAPPAEDAKLFVSFMVLRLRDRSGCLSGTPGFYMGANTHPNRNVSAEIEMVDVQGNSASQTVSLPAQGTALVSCTTADQVNRSMLRVHNAAFTTTQ
jgi:hypothetical protein